MKYVQSDNKFIVEMIHCHLNNARDKLLLCLTVDLIKYAWKACFSFQSQLLVNEPVMNISVFS